MIVLSWLWFADIFNTISVLEMRKFFENRGRTRISLRGVPGVRRAMKFAGNEDYQEINHF